DVGDAQRVADRRVGRRTPALAVDVLPAAELHDVVDDQEVPREAEFLDHVQLVVELAVGVRAGGTGAVPAQRPLLGQVAQPAHLGVPFADLAVGQSRRDEVEVEGQLGAEGGGPGDRARIGGEPGRHLVAAAQVGYAGGGQPAVQLVQ